MHAVDKSRTATPEAARARARGGLRIAAKAPPPKTDFDLVDLMGEAGWRDADQALAASLRDFADAERAAALLAEGKDAVEDALLMLGQSLAQAARRRGLKRFGVVGAIEAYDPRLHELTRRGAKAPALVKLVAEGVSRGDGAGAEILLRALAAPTRAKRAP